MAILYVAAEAAELNPLAEKLTNSRSLKWPIDFATEGILGGRRILLAANGAGPRLASQALEVAIRAVAAADLSASRLEGVACVGYCGALTSAHHAGDILFASEVLDQASGQVFPCVLPPDADPARTGRFVSQDRVANTAAEKSQLAATGALAVEMEAAGVAARAERASLPFLCIKVVTDGADESFRFDLNAMRTREGRVARGKIVTYAVTHPWLLPELFRLKGRAESAAKALGEFLVSCRITFGQPSTDRAVIASE